MQIVTDQFQKELKSHGSESFPLLVSYERLSRYESGSFSWHWHPELELTLIQKGQMVYKVNQMIFHLKEGDLLLGNAGVLHTGFREDETSSQDCQYISVTFSPKLLYGFFQNVVYSRYVEPFVKNFDLPALLFDGSESWHTDICSQVCSIIRLDQEKPDFYELDIIICLQNLWKNLLKNLPPAPQKPLRGGAEYDRIREIVTYIELNYMNKISLKDIADHICLNENACSHLFRRYMNISLVNFLQEYRIERSLEYLHKGETISHISEKVGFSNPYYYSRVFTKIKGMSPQKYRNTYGR